MSKRNGKMKYLAIGAIGLIAAGGLALDTTYQIQEQEQAVLTTFGVPKAVKKRDYISKSLLYSRCRR